MKPNAWTTTCALLLLAGCASGVGDDAGNPIYTSTTASTQATSVSDDEAEAEAESESGAEAGDSTTTSTTTTTNSSEEGNPVCGNGVKEGDEECDGNDVGGLTCLDFGHDNGALICADDCKLFTNACSTCGDGQLAATEACDGTNFGGLTCTDLGYSGGTLSCAADCSQIFEGNCQVAPTCGNGALDANETCDGGNLGGQTCVTLGYDGGVLACNQASCIFDTSACTIQMCVPLLGACNILVDECCEGLTCGLFACVPE